MKWTMPTVLLASALLTVAQPLLADTPTERLDESATVLKEIMNAPDQGIPQRLLDRAYCVVIVPGVKKAAFLVGGKFGKGFIVCRNSETGAWGAPAAVRVEGGSFGFQIGGSETDVVMLVMDKSGKDSILKSKFTLGGDVSVAAGPVGRSSSAETDAAMRAKILSYSRSRGVFAGVALNGATLRQDEDEDKALYGKPVSNREILDGQVSPPPAASDLISTLDRLAPHRAG